MLLTEKYIFDRYTTLYNAECDTAVPRPVSQLIRQIEREERDEAKVANSRSVSVIILKTLYVNIL